MKIRPYKDGDEKGIFDLDRRLETHPWNRRTLDNWYWKYTDKNPSGRSFVWLMEEDDKIIAHFAAVPYRLKVCDTEIIASHSIGALVEEKYQNRGLLKFVSDKMFEELKENNIPFTYGFPNDRSYVLHKTHMGYADLIKFDTWKIEKDGIDKIRNKNGGGSSFKDIKEFDCKFDELWKECSGEYEIAVVRNKEYLNWRHLGRPDSKYYPFGIYAGNILKGYVVLKLYKDDKTLRCNILDIFGHRDDKETLRKALDIAFDFFYGNNVDEVTCWIWGSKLLEKLFEEKGYTKITSNIPLVIRINQEFEYHDIVKDDKYWYFTMSDSTEIF